MSFSTEALITRTEMQNYRETGDCRVAPERPLTPVTQELLGVAPVAQAFEIAE